MAQRVILLGVRKFDGEIDGKRLKSHKLTYTSGRRTVNRGDSGEEIGCELFTDLRVSEDVYGQAHTVPGIYEAEFEMKPRRGRQGGAGGAELELVELRFVKPCDLRSLVVDEGGAVGDTDPVKRNGAAPALAGAGAR